MKTSIEIRLRERRTTRNSVTVDGNLKRDLDDAADTIASLQDALSDLLAEYVGELRHNGDFSIAIEGRAEVQKARAALAKC